MKSSNELQLVRVSYKINHRALQGDMYLPYSFTCANRHTGIGIFSDVAMVETVLKNTL